MNTDQLHYLIALSQNTSINAASLKLHITPQALSTAIKKLEEELGFSLLNRSFKGISLTDDGEWLVKESSEFLNKIEDRKQRYQTEPKDAYFGLLEIDINYSGIGDNVLAQLICTLSEEEPNLKIILREKSKEQILTDVLTNTSEIGFIFQTKLNGVYVDELDDDLLFESLVTGDLVLSTTESSELAKFNSITIKKAAQYPLCSYHPYPDSYESLQHFITDCFNLPVQYERETNFSIYKEKIQRGMANAFSTLFNIEKFPNNYVEGTKIIHIRDDIRIYFGFVKKKDTVLSENTRFFLEELKSLAQKLKNKK